MRKTLLEPLDPSQQHWTLFEFAGHFDISIGLAAMLVDGSRPGRPGRARPSKLLHLPAFRGRAGRLRLRLHDGRGEDAGEGCRRCWRRRSRRTIGGSGRPSEELIGRRVLRPDGAGGVRAQPVVEAVVHGLDLTDALGADPIATPDGRRWSCTGILDELLGSPDGAGSRRPDLADDL